MIKSTKPFSRSLRTLTHVPRWSIVRLIQRQSVMEHQGLVAIYADQIADIIGWDGDRRSLLMAALSHDWTEVETGDMPGPFKKSVVDGGKLDDFEREVYERRFGGEPRITDDPMVHYILKTADMLEAVLFLVSERRLGNHGVTGVLLTSYALLVRTLDNYTLEQRTRVLVAIHEALRDEWRGQDGIPNRDLESQGYRLQDILKGLEG